MSIRSAREKLALENEHRDDLLQKARMVRSKLVSGKGSLSKISPPFREKACIWTFKALNDSDLLVPQKSASLGVLPSATGRPVVTSPTRSIRHGLVSPWREREWKNTIYRTTYVIQINPPQSSPHVPPPLNFKTSSISMPASLASGRSSTSSRTRQNDRLVRWVISVLSNFCTIQFRLRADYYW